MVDNLEKNKCNGCNSCYNICSVDAIEMTSDSEGFSYPIISYDKCINCGKCDEVCPQKNATHRNNRKIPEVYAAWSLEDEIRINSTSGGIFSEIAMKVIEKSGYICGAIYNDNNMVEHHITSNTEGLKKLRQSKYVQSNIGFVYKQIGLQLKKEKLVLFCGTPCECAGLESYLKCIEIDRDKLIILDFVCRGSNSPKVYDMFLKHLENKYESVVQKVWFKNKTFGWNRFSTRIEFKNGENYIQDRFSDSYMRGYIESNLYIRPSCGDCKFKGFPRISDITLGDFWGIELEDKTMDTDNGTSLVLINSDMGDKLFGEIKNKIFCEKKELKDALLCNPSIIESVVHGESRYEFMKDLDVLDIMENINRFLK